MRTWEAQNFHLFKMKIFFIKLLHSSFKSVDLLSNSWRFGSTSYWNKNECHYQEMYKFALHMAKFWREEENRFRTVSKSEKMASRKMFSATFGNFMGKHKIFKLWFGLILMSKELLHWLVVLQEKDYLSTVPLNVVMQGDKSCPAKLICIYVRNSNIMFKKSLGRQLAALDLC